jgi:hypothetical protein
MKMPMPDFGGNGKKNVIMSVFGGHSPEGLAGEPPHKQQLWQKKRTASI